MSIFCLMALNTVYTDDTQILSLTSASTPNTKLLCPMPVNISVCLINITKIMHQNTTFDLLPSDAQTTVFSSSVIWGTFSFLGHKNIKTTRTLLLLIQCYLFVSKFCQLYLHNPFQMSPTNAVSSPIHLSPMIKCTDYRSCFLSGLSSLSLAPLQTVFNTAANIIFFTCQTNCLFKRLPMASHTSEWKLKLVV